MAKRTLAQFLYQKGLLGRLLEQARHSITYLLSVLGESFLTDTSKGEFWSSGYSGPLLGSEYGEFTLNATDPLRWLSQGEQVTALHNVDFLRQHLEFIESSLLGSRTMDGSSHVTCHEKIVAPVPQNEIVPFTALLGKDQVDCGPHGKAGGFDPSSENRIYNTPVDGENRPLPRKALHARLSDFRGQDEMPARNHVMFVGRPFFDYDLPWEESMEATGPGGDKQLVQRYTGVESHMLRPRLARSVLMPDNAVYLVAPRRVCVHANPICGVITDDSDQVVVRTFSRIAHSLLHHSDLEMRRELPEISPRALEKYHAAFLAVTSPKGSGSGD